MLHMERRFFLLTNPLICIIFIAGCPSEFLSRTLGVGTLLEVALDALHLSSDTCVLSEIGLLFTPLAKLLEL